MPRTSKEDIDPEFWNHLRETLRSYLSESGLPQRQLAFMLGINPTTLSNFLNHQTEAMGGLPVALACTIVNLECNGVKIGRVVSKPQVDIWRESNATQLILEFDGSFELGAGSKHPTLLLRKSPKREVLRLAVRRLG